MSFLGALPARFRRERVLIVGCGDVGLRAARELGAGRRVRLMALTSTPARADALRAAGITRDTPDPADGRIERDDDGHPTGTLHEGAMALVGALVPETTEDELYDGLMAGQAYLHSLGVTGWQDAIIGDYAGMTDPGPSYRRAVEPDGTRLLMLPLIEGATS